MSWEFYLPLKCPKWEKKMDLDVLSTVLGLQKRGALPWGERPWVTLLGTSWLGFTSLSPYPIPVCLSWSGSRGCKFHSNFARFQREKSSAEGWEVHVGEMQLFLMSPCVETPPSWEVMVSWSSEPFPSLSFKKEIIWGLEETRESSLLCGQKLP